jgi:hypothetical protein
LCAWSISLRARLDASRLPALSQLARQVSGRCRERWQARGFTTFRCPSDGEIVQHARSRAPGGSLVDPECRLGRELDAACLLRGERSRDPHRALAFDPGAEIGRERAEPGAALRGEEAPEVGAGDTLAEELLGGRVRRRHVERVVELDDRVHRAADQAAELLLALAHLGLGTQALQLGGRARREDLEERLGPRLGRHRAAVEHGQVAEDAAVDAEERDAQIAHGPCLVSRLVVRIELEHVVGNVHQPAALDDLRARRAVDRVLEVLDPLAAEPERERPQPARLRQVLGDPGAVRAEHAREALDQGPEESVTRVGGGTLDDRAQRGALVDALEGWRGIVHGGRARSAGRWGVYYLGQPAKWRQRRVPLPPPKTPCPARRKASQAGRRRIDPGRPLSKQSGILTAFSGAISRAPAAGAPVSPRPGERGA